MAQRIIRKEGLLSSGDLQNEGFILKFIMSKYFKRIGTSKFRYQFDILLQEARINLPGLGATPIAMVFKRGGFSLTQGASGLRARGK